MGEHVKAMRSAKTSRKRKAEKAALSALSANQVLLNKLNSYKLNLVCGDCDAVWWHVDMNDTPEASKTSDGVYKHKQLKREREMIVVRDANVKRSDVVAKAIEARKNPGLKNVDLEKELTKRSSSKSSSKATGTTTARRKRYHARRPDAAPRKLPKRRSPRTHRNRGLRNTAAHSGRRK